MSALYVTATHVHNISIEYLNYCFNMSHVQSSLLTQKANTVHIGSGDNGRVCFGEPALKPKSITPVSP